jgi:hypothetical protein
MFLNLVLAKNIPQACNLYCAIKIYNGWQGKLDHPFIFVSMNLHIWNSFRVIFFLGPREVTYRAFVFDSLNKQKN